MGKVGQPEGERAYLAKTFGGIEIKTLVAAQLSKGATQTGEKRCTTRTVVFAEKLRREKDVKRGKHTLCELLQLGGDLTKAK